MPNPIAFEIGPLAIRWYGILISTAILLGTILVLKEAERFKLNQDKILNLIIIVLPAAFVGARLWYVIFNWSYYSAEPSQIIQVWNGGLAIHGGLIGGILAGYWYSRIAKFHFLQLADIFAPSIILGQAIGRWGNYFNQEAYGYETNLPWAMYIDGAYRHPTFLYESLWNVGVFVFLLWLRRKKDILVGEVFLAYIALYSLGRLFIEGLRTDSLMIGPFRTAQLVSLTVIIVAIAIIIIRRKAKPTTKKRQK
ncbi:MAG: prolipoprotein diacylglyceryl transferase [Bacillota bacterium]|nr:prolipoprotein diacylglyceryl transferase [Bacillota bacterium]